MGTPYNPTMTSWRLGMPLDEFSELPPPWSSQFSIAGCLDQKFKGTRIGRWVGEEDCDEGMMSGGQG